MKDLKRFYQQRAWLFFMENPVLVRLMIKKNDQELVDNLQDSLNLLRSNMRSCKN